MGGIQISIINKGKKIVPLKIIRKKDKLPWVSKKNLTDNQTEKSSSF